VFFGVGEWSGGGGGGGGWCVHGLRNQGGGASINKICRGAFLPEKDREILKKDNETSGVLLKATRPSPIYSLKSRLCIRILSLTRTKEDERGTANI